MSIISDIRDAIAVDLATIAISPPLRASAYIPTVINPPVAVVAHGLINYDTTFGRGSDEYPFTVTVYVSRVSERSSQLYLDELCDPTGASSLKTVLEAPTTTVAALIQYLRVQTVGPVQAVDIAEAQYLSVEFSVEVCA